MTGIDDDDRAAVVEPAPGFAAAGDGRAGAADSGEVDGPCWRSLNREAGTRAGRGRRVAADEVAAESRAAVELQAAVVAMTAAATAAYTHIATGRTA